MSDYRIMCPVCRREVDATFTDMTLVAQREGAWLDGARLLGACGHDFVFKRGRWWGPEPA